MMPLPVTTMPRERERHRGSLGTARNEGVSAPSTGPVPWPAARMSQREGIWILTRDLLISRGWTLKKKKIFFECASPNSRPHKMPGLALGPRSSTACACREQPSRACTRGQEAPGWRGDLGDCALGELLDGCAAAGPPPSADASSSGGRAASPCPSACSQRPHRDGTDSVPCEHLLEPNRREG